MGLEEDANRGICVEDIKLAMMGHVKEGYEFKYGSKLTEGDRHYNKQPTLNDKVHVLACVVPVDKVLLLSDAVMRKMREVRLAARDIGIPQVAILTKIDEACPEVKSDIRKTYTNDYLKEKVEQFSQVLGIPLNCIFLVKNYHSESFVKEDVDTLILCALRKIIDYGEDFLNDV
ncbi:hypothetical protein LDENG_00272500 [Lucifuga dentata]|nr:hypothetical protein LDENG_00272500 [Lucifuga dentata]